MLQWANDLAFHPILIAHLNLVALILFSILVFYACRAYYIRFLRFLTKNWTGFLSKAIFSEKFLFQLSWILPVIIVNQGLLFIENLPETTIKVFSRLSMLSLVYFGTRAISVFLNVFNVQYEQSDYAKNQPLKGPVQIAQLILWFAGLILFISVLLDKSPLIFLSGLGAMTAVLLLIFKDTLLSFVAGFKLTTNNLIKVGDWIEMPSFQADGDVIDIALHSIRICNWDKTITNIPTHSFLDHSFKNWRGMTEAGGRRIKRSVFIDMRSIHFLDDKELQNLKRFELLKDYLNQKEIELQEHNVAYKDSADPLLNSRRLTNIGTFRAYVITYLKNHPNIHKELNIMVRQLAPTAQGLPLEIYVFTNDVRWAVYEGIQADIFDHILAILPVFSLNIFQEVSGNDFSKFLLSSKMTLNEPD